MPTLKGSGLETAVGELLTVTFTWAIFVRADAGTTAVNCVLLTKVVANARGPKSAVELVAKLVPVRVMVTSGPPTREKLGLILVRVGAVNVDTLMVNGRKLDTVLSGLRTNRFTGIASMRLAAGTVAVNTVLDTKAVGASAVPRSEERRVGKE